MSLVSDTGGSLATYCLPLSKLLSTIGLLSSSCLLNALWSSCEEKKERRKERMSDLMSSCVRTSNSRTREEHCLAGGNQFSRVSVFTQLFPLCEFKSTIASQYRRIVYPMETSKWCWLVNAELIHRIAIKVAHRLHLRSYSR